MTSTAAGTSPRTGRAALLAAVAAGVAVDLVFALLWLGWGALMWAVVGECDLLTLDRPWWLPVSGMLLAGMGAAAAAALPVLASRPHVGIGLLVGAAAAVLPVIRLVSVLGLMIGYGDPAIPSYCPA